MLLVCWAVGGDPAVVEGDDAVDPAQGLRAVGDHDGGAVSGCGAHGVFDATFAVQVEVRGGLIEDEHTRIMDECSGQADELSLPR